MYGIGARIGEEEAAMTELAPVGRLLIHEIVDRIENVCKGTTGLRIPVTITGPITVESAIKVRVSESKPYSHFQVFRR
jgi:hypothetical protein